MAWGTAKVGPGGVKASLMQLLTPTGEPPPFLSISLHPHHVTVKLLSNKKVTFLLFSVKNVIFKVLSALKCVLITFVEREIFVSFSEFSVSEFMIFGLLF